MKILVIGGMHGNEPLGPSVVALFQQKPLKNIDVVLANQPAIRQNRRFVQQDLNRSFPGNAGSKAYEPRRAAELLQLSKKYDLVLDFHNTHCPENDCGFVGDTAPKALYDTSWLLGLSRVVVADYDCINKYVPNCLSVEVSLNSSLNRPEVWYERIAQLARLNKVCVSANVTRYRFVYRMTLEDRDKYQLDRKNLQAFQPMPAKIAKQLGVKTPASPIFIGDSYTPYNYGGVLREIPRRATK